jgi:mannose-6-phosphate isomerase-like protein (cupin superfamily)
MGIEKFLKKLDEASEEKKIKKSGFHTNIESDTIKNDHFRKVLFTATSLQLVVMSLKPGEDIGLEMHSNVDQFIRVDEGSGEALIGDKKYSLKDGDAIIIPRGSKHNITASEEGIKVYTLYSPPNHIDKTIHKTKQDAIEDEADESFGERASDK